MSGRVHKFFHEHAVISERAFRLLATQPES
jgi:hypothetical protein